LKPLDIFVESVPVHVRINAGAPGVVAVFPYFLRNPRVIGTIEAVRAAEVRIIRIVRVVRDRILAIVFDVDVSSRERTSGEIEDIPVNDRSALRAAGAIWQAELLRRAPAKLLELDAQAAAAGFGVKGQRQQGQRQQAGNEGSNLKGVWIHSARAP